MPKPKSKQELIDLSQDNYRRLLALINTFSEKEREKVFPKGTLNRNIRDVCAHLHHWHLLMLQWYEVGMKGEKPDMPTKEHTWKTLPALNRQIQETYQHYHVKIVLTLLEDSYTQIQSMISRHTDTELFEKKRYKWTGTTSLGAYLISNTSSHYDWAIKLIKKSMK